MKIKIALGIFLSFFCFLSATGQQNDYEKCIHYFKDSCLYYKAIVYGRKALNDPSVQNDPLKKTRVMKSIGMSYTYFFIHYDSASYFLNEALKIARQHHYQNDRLEIEIAIGNNYIGEGYIDKASHLLFQTLREVEKQKDQTLYARNTQVIGRLYGFENKHKMAIQQYKKATALYLKQKDVINASLSYINLGFAYTFLKQYDKAIQIFTRADELYPNMHHGYGKYRYLEGMSTVLAYIEKYDESLEMCKKGLIVTKEIGFKSAEEDFIRRMGYLYLATKKINEAKKIGNLLLENIAHDPSKRGRMFNYMYLSEMSFAEKDYKTACTYRAQYGLYKDSVINESYDQKILEMKTIYETEKKDLEINEKKKEIKYLENEKQLASYRFFWILSIIITAFLIVLIIVNYFRTKYKREKISADHQKELLELETARKIKALEIQILHAQMNPHFVFNCLSAIQHLFMSGDQLTANEKLSNFSKLLRMSIDHVKNNFVTLEDELKFLKYYIDLEQLQFNQPFEYELQNECSDTFHEIEIPSMILQPFVENAINHGLKNKGEGGKLLIRIYRQDQWIHILIDDNGVGREMAGQIKKMSSHNHVSKGLKLVTEKINALKELNSIQVHTETTDKTDESGNPSGTQVIISIQQLNPEEE